MKKFIFILCTIALVACKEEPKNYATLSGTITNAHDNKTVRIFKDSYEKIITMNDDGSFSDTLNIEEGDYRFKHGDEYGTIYLKNNNVSSFTTDYEDFDSALIFEGDGSDINNLSIKSYLLGDDYFTMDLFYDLDNNALEKAIADYKSGFENLKVQYKNVDSLHLASADKRMNSQIESVENYFNYKIGLKEAFPQGMPSPSFENYENHKGGTTSLSDLKGKYVYIDVWATWCGPCKREIPSLKKVEEDYKDKNIAFVSISVDAPKRHSGSADKAHEAWKKMVAEKELGGVQLIADKDYDSDFMKAYQVNSIPRFLLIDPEGNIVSGDAPRPSSDRLIELFDSLNI
ncbi:TlpA disulfide reductase family protein [Yeosuana sp. MJ-SS3]|uniref:TlpA disulfide reductase family protein n=1 Tax=Gilvirhabdus luticola TaxID=3079858 RepID=A0ABU3U9X4_9FLAO|nr:TlpA disulfide reductase family protein [Yeosuana sp. MJ-SS3]MDU8887129.1 TlpA disulfide reductase family protein [Yeosuana sp. MJ-SS3]